MGSKPTKKEIDRLTKQLHKSLEKLEKQEEQFQKGDRSSVSSWRRDSGLR